jgi:hypothetical protein
MTHGPARILELPWRERRWLGVSLLMLPATALALRVVAVRHLSSLIARPRSHRREPPDRARAERIAHMVAAAAHYGPYRASCLPQSLVLQWLLRRDGMRGELRYGVRKIDARVTAHCWVELDGEPLIDSPEVRRQFTVLEPSTAASRWGR